MKTWLGMLFAALLLSGLCLSCGDDDNKAQKDATVDQQQVDLASPDTGAPDQAAADVAVDTLSPDYGNLADCPIEKDLTSLVPCRCFTTVATAAAVQACASTLKCCPLAKKPVCE